MEHASMYTRRQVPVILASGAASSTEESPSNSGSVDLPLIFSTPFRPDLISKAFVHLASHSFQPQGRYPMAGMNVVADTNDPPTGRGISRIARATGGGGRRRGEGAEVASTRGGRQAHPPKSEKVIYKKLNKKEGRLALCSAVAATASKKLVEGRGHKISEYLKQYDGNLPIIVDDDITQHATASDVMLMIGRLGLDEDIDRLRGRKARSGKPALRGRSKKGGKSILFVTHNSQAPLARAVGALPGVDARSVDELSVLDLAPGSDPIRLAVFTKSAIKQLGQIKSTHLGVMVYDDNDNDNDDNGVDATAPDAGMVQDAPDKRDNAPDNNDGKLGSDNDNNRSVD